MKGMTEAAYKAHQQRIHKPAERAKLVEVLRDALWVRPTKRSKHGNVRLIVDGIRFDSKHEAQCWRDLRLRERAGEIRNLQRQVSFPMQVNGQKVHRVVLDFWWREKDPVRGLWEIVVADAKSAHTASLPAWKRAKALFEAAYGISVQEL